MSRGLGSFQRKILDELPSSGGISLNALCWQLALEAGDGRPIVSRPFYSGFLRAVRTLLDGRHVVCIKRKLRNLEELCSLYPHKSGTFLIRELRQNLLPLIEVFLRGRHAMRFGTAQNEIHILRGLPDNQLKVAQTRWAPIETALLAQLSSIQDSNQSAVFDVIVKGRQLFSASTVAHRAPLGRLIEQAIASVQEGSRAEAALFEGREFYSSIFPASDLDLLRLKSVLHEVAQLGRNSAQNLKSDFIKFLTREATDVVRALPGYKSAHSERVGVLRLPIREEPSPLLHKLIQRDAFGPFEFISTPVSGLLGDDI